jgi:putative phage-type endonuclease
MTNEEWLRERRKGLGGSDIGVILGVNPYRTPYQLWLDKTGRSPPLEENKFMLAGKLIEPVIVEMFRLATGFEILPEAAQNTLYHHPKFPFILGTPDRIYEHMGRQGILECKNTRTPTTIDNLPKSWFCQLQWYMGLTGIHFGHIAWLVQGYDFFYHEIEFMPEFWELMISEATIFWKHVLNDDPPPIQNRDDLDRIFSHEITGKTVIAQESTLELYYRLIEIRSKSSELKSEESFLIGTLKMLMQDSETLTSDQGKILVSWQSTGNGSRRFLIKK